MICTAINNIVIALGCLLAVSNGKVKVRATRRACVPVENPSVLNYCLNVESGKHIAYLKPMSERFATETYFDGQLCLCLTSKCDANCPGVVFYTKW